MPAVEIRTHRGTPALFLDGEPRCFASLWFWPPRGDRPWRHGAEIDYFRDAGIRCYNWFDVWEEPVDYRRRRYTFEGLADHIEKIRAHDPDGLLVIKQNADAPDWWKRRFPGDVERLRVPRGLTVRRRIQSYASQRWRDDITDYLWQMVAFIRSQAWGEQVIAVLPCGGGSGEWMSGSTNYSLDYSRPMAEHFRAWLKRRYRTVARLRSAWGDTRVGFGDARAPSWQDFNAGYDFGFRDPRQSRPVLDYLACSDELVADCVIEECRAVRQAAGGRMFTGTYIDKTMEAYWPMGFWEEGKDQPRQVPMLLGGGNGAIMKVLKSPHVQALASPYSYVYRGTGGAAGYMQLVESCHLHGKLVIYEDDARQWVSPLPAGEYGKPATPQETIVQVTRNFGNILARGTGLWWGYPWNKSAEEGGWNNVRVMGRVRRLAELGRLSVAADRHRDSVAEIAVVCDTVSENYLRPDFARGWDSVVRQRIWEFGRIGTPHDLYHLDDLVSGKMRPYEVVIFPNAYALSASQIRRIHRYLAACGGTAVWVYASGYVRRGGGRDALSVANMSRATGIAMRRYDVEWPATVTVTDYDHPVTRELPEHVTYGWRSTQGPIFFADDPEARTLGTVVHWRGKCEPGLVIKDMGGWRSVWSAVPCLPAGLLRGIARHAAAHIWSERDDVFYAGRNWLCVHPLKGGRRTFRLPRACTVHDAITGRRVSASCRSFTVNVQPGSVALFRLG